MLTQVSFSFFLFVASLVSPSEASHLSPKRFVSARATEATLSFHHEVRFNHSEAPSEEKVLAAIERQIHFLFGTLALTNPIAAPISDHQISNVEVHDLGNGAYSASYDYQGTILAGLANVATLSIFLPRNPDTIYKAGEVIQGSKVLAPCTDPAHPGAYYFWYFWNPFKKGCPLRAGKDFDWISAKLTRLPNTPHASYPEYNRLANKAGEVQMHAFYGMNQPSVRPNPNTSNDENAPSYRKVRAQLISRGFTARVWGQNDFAPYGENGSLYAYVEEFSGKKGTTPVKVRMFFGDTGLSSLTVVFQKLWVEAVNSGAVVLYDGHSGLGSNLNVAKLEKSAKVKVAPPLDQYQLFFFNGCSTYAYYGKQYQQLKASTSDPLGTKGMDVMVNGLETLFAVMGNTSWSVMDSVLRWAETKQAVSYQTLAANIDSNNLFAIMGDEDN